MLESGDVVGIDPFLRNISTMNSFMVYSHSQKQKKFIFELNILKLDEGVLQNPFGNFLKYEYLKLCQDVNIEA